jgi:MerR family transcriptional regulator, redox-sensitive transcriptional activator SoxR
MAANQVLTVSQVVQRSGVAASALRYYEREGLLQATRTGGGQRRYDRSVLRRLAFIRAARNVGLALAEVRAELAELPESRTPTKADWTRISKDWRYRLDEQIAALKALRDGLDSCIGCGCLSLRSCSMSNPGDIAATYSGTGGAAYLPAFLRRQPDGEALNEGVPDARPR